VNGASRDASKEVIVARVLEKKILQLYPSWAAEIPEIDDNASDKFLLNDKFCLINVVFSDELSDEAIRSEESATHAELDAVLAGYKL